MDGG
ncbi:hypothetical protein A2U01_0068822, partial [Trifolium medium]|jgi:hypothetical protein